MQTSSAPISLQQKISARISRARKKFPFAANVALLSGGASLGHCFTLAAAPLLTRLYVPADIGSLGLFTAFLAVAAVATGLQYDVAIVSAEGEKEAAHIAKLSVLFALPMSIVSGFVLYALIHSSVLGFGALPGYAAWLMTFSLFFAGLFSSLRYWSIRSESFGVVSQAVVFQNGGRSVSQVIFGALGSHSFGLLLSEAIGRGLGMSRMARAAWPVVRRYPLTRAESLRALRRQRRFPVYSLPSSLLNLLGTSLPLPLLVTLYGADAGGYYSLVWRVLAVPVVLVGASMADAFHSQAALYARKDPDRLLRFFHTCTAGLLAIGILPSAAILFYGREVFAFAFGAKWRVAGAMASIVAPWFLTSFVVSPLSRLVYVLQGQRLKLIYDVLTLLGNLVVFVLVRRLGWPMLHMVVAMSVVNTATRIVYYLVLLRIARRGYRPSSGPVTTQLNEAPTA